MGDNSGKVKTDLKHGRRRLGVRCRGRAMTEAEKRTWDGWPGQFLQQAVLYDNVELLQCLLEGDERANINAGDNCGRTAIYTAVSNNSLRCLRLLLEHAGDANLAAGERCHSMAPLHLAVLDGKNEALELLLKQDVNLMPLDESGQSPLALAKVIGNSVAVFLLETEIARRMERLKNLSARLCAACARGDKADVAESLKESGLHKEQVLNLIPDRDLPPLCSASLAGSLEVVKMLMKNGAAPVCQRGSGLTPLHLACQAGHTPVAQYLLKKFPDLAMSKSVEHKLPLHLAAAHSDPECMQAILNQDYPENLMQTFSYRFSSVKYRAGFDINSQDSQGKAALHVACEKGLEHNVKALLQFSAKVSQVSDNADAVASESGETTGQKVGPGSRPLSQVHRMKSWDSVLSRNKPSVREGSRHNLHKLQSQCSNLSHDHTPSPDENSGGPLDVHPVLLGITSNEGMAPLHYAIKNHHPAIVRSLLDHGADPTQEAVLKDRVVSPLILAFENLDLGILRLLLDTGLVEDVDNHVLEGALLCQDFNVLGLLLEFKVTRDPQHSVNKSELLKLCGQGRGEGQGQGCGTAGVWGVGEGSEEGSGSAPEGVGEGRPRTLACGVAVQWQGLNGLQKVELDSLVRAGRRLNPAIRTQLAAAALCTITKVDISNNIFRSFPECLFTLPSLVVLVADSNQLEELPEEEDHPALTLACPALEELHLRHNRLFTLPAYLFRFPALRYLDVSFNCLEELPAEMWTAPSLVTLDLTKNCLAGLPLPSRHCSVPRKMSAAKRMSGASLVGSAGGFAAAGSFRRGEAHSSSVSLSSFDLEVNTSLLDDSVESGEGVGLLARANVTTNEVIHINKWSSALKVVDRDPWRSSRSQVGLRQLRLGRNRLATFPPGLSCLAPSLEVLDLSDNSLEGVAPIADLPAALCDLCLSHCGLTTLQPWRRPPDTVKDAAGGCEACRVLAYSPPGYSSPSSRASPSTVSRESYGNVMSILSCPHRSHTTLARLEKLNLSRNRLDSMVLIRAPDGQASNGDTQSMSFGLESEELQQRLLFPSLAELDLSLNHLNGLTSDIGEQSALKILSLRGNRGLKELPSKLGLLKNLWKLDLELCPLDGVIQDLLQGSRFPVRDILGFLLSILEESTLYMCMNLMLVGCHKIGKTSLLRKLCKEGRAPNKPTHWRDRVSKQEGVSRGQTLSTVGIDINELLFDCGAKGTVSFRTWDFGGQREYYATHQYFLSPRSLYLVMWSVIEGERGVEGLQQWLINIQARAPGAPVIIVGTHVDVLRDKATRRNFPPDFEEAMTGMVHKLFLSNSEPDKCGLPNIIDAINISCKTGENVRKLVDIIKNNVFELRHAKSKTVKLLGQKIPRKYLLLQTVVRELAMERINDFKDPVLTRAKYMLCVSDRMMEKGFTTFRDVEELEQATRFLHENGVLFHWDDHALKDLYFLDPQWLCDQLAKVITVREINNFAQRGVMRISNLEFLFRSTTFQPEDVRQYITSLLAKFEVALQFDEEHLILPSLLPVRQTTGQRQADTKIPLRKASQGDITGADSKPCVPRRRESMNRSYRPRVNSGPDELHIGTSVFYAGSQVERDPPKTQVLPWQQESSSLHLLAVKPCSNPIFSFCRLYFMTYFPSGFWSRLIVRVLADTTLQPVVRDLFSLPQDLLDKSPETRTLVDRDPEWRCWQSGLELCYMGFEMLRVGEVTLSQGPGSEGQQVCDYSQCRFKCSVEREWCYLDIANSRILEISFPTDSLRLHVSTRDGPSSLHTLDLDNATTAVRCQQATARLLMKMVEHIDTLLQDWYPELGEIRFHQNCEGRYLVTRVVPCPQCLAREVARQKSMKKEEDSWFFVNSETPDVFTPFIVSEDSHARQLSSVQVLLDPSGSVPANGQSSELTDSGHSKSLSEGQAFIYNRENSGEGGEAVIYSYLVERCMLEVMQGVDTVCPVHGSVSPQHLLDTSGVSHVFHIAPDVVFSDLGHELLFSNTDQLEVGPCLGEGNFGKVYEGVLHWREKPPEAVALKILFEMDRSRRTSTLHGFQQRLESACSAYLTARQEVSILEQLSHAHIVPFLGLALQPLALVLGLAPHGALTSVLKRLNAAGTHLPLFVICQVIIQVSKALAYLHQHHIIYRDLKSENVLVWDLPLTSDAGPDALVHVKIADYGISRAVLPSGTKGFGGTPAFIAPEILQQAGKGTYNEKVDMFSLGMFIFELITCRFPFLDISNPNTLVCQGGRPSLTTQEVERSPPYLLDLLSLCWSHDPADRPSAARVVTAVSSPQFLHLADSLSLGPEVGVLCGVALPPADRPTNGEHDLSTSASSGVFGAVRPAQVWLSSCTGSTSALEVFSFPRRRNTVIDYKTLPLGSVSVTAMCVVDNTVWCASADGILHIYDADTLTQVQELQLTAPPVVVLSLHALPGGQQVLAVATSPDCSIIFVCRPALLGGVGGEVVAEQFRVFRCYSSALVHVTDRWELWLGQASGSVLVWDVMTQQLTDTLFHTLAKLPPSTTCIFLVSSSSLPSPLHAHEEQGSAHAVARIWSYNFPGTVVYCWDVENRCVLEKLDCSAIYSTADTIFVGSPQQTEAAQVTAMTVVNWCLYLGTTRGCLIVADALTLRPLCLFPAHAPRDFFVRCILPIPGAADRDGDAPAQGLVSVGRGYADLLTPGGSRKVSAASAEGRGGINSGPSDGFAHHTFLLAWAASDWECC